MIIGNVSLKNNIILAPMAGVSDLPFRLLCVRMGAALEQVEKVSAYKGLSGKNALFAGEAEQRVGGQPLEVGGADHGDVAGGGRREQKNAPLFSFAAKYGIIHAWQIFWLWMTSPEYCCSCRVF